jgi:hypothetical protein
MSTVSFYIHVIFQAYWAFLVLIYRQRPFFINAELLQIDFFFKVFIILSAQTVLYQEVKTYENDKSQKNNSRHTNT